MRKCGRKSFVGSNRVVSRLRRSADKKLITASRTPRLLNSLGGPSRLAGIAVHRFADHQPYYRLEEIQRRGGLTISRAT